MAIRIAFVGFRHGHISGLYSLAASRDDVEIAGACEEDAGARDALTGTEVVITHDSYAAMLDDVECDVVACGDYYAVRGERLIAAVESGRHVIGDKPLCTSLVDLDQIERLARDKGVRVGCMLDLGQGAPFQTLRRLLREGLAGEVHTIHFDGQHPLNYGQRPAWYFEAGKHGGTINDIAIHAIDGIPWLTGRNIVEITAARAWNARHREHPHFQDGAVLMMRLDNDGVVTGDVSYLTPEAHSYRIPSYWRFCVAGSQAYVETSATVDKVLIYTRDAETVREEPLDSERRGAYWDDFVADISGRPNPDGLRTERVLRSSRITLVAQHAADTGEFPVRV
jgi:predicted dehydrogenase